MKLRKKTTTQIHTISHNTCLKRSCSVIERKDVAWRFYHAQRIHYATINNYGFHIRFVQSLNQTNIRQINFILNSMLSLTLFRFIWFGSCSSSFDCYFSHFLLCVRFFLLRLGWFLRWTRLYNIYVMYLSVIFGLRANQSIVSSDNKKISVWSRQWRDAREFRITNKIPITNVYASNCLEVGRVI